MSECPGIAEEDTGKLFTKYYRAANNGQKGSTGLGLAIAHNLVERHKGSITVQSELGVGSVFTVTLPKLDAPAA